MKKTVFCLLMLLMCITMAGQQRRPIDSRHPIWFVHIDVWNQADPQKIIDLIPDDIKPYVCMNLSMSCQFDEAKGVYKMPQDAVQTYKSWATVCQHNGLWFMCQPASGGKTHILDSDMTTFEYFFKHYPNFLGWNYCEQFWGFDESDRNSATQTDRIALFARLVEMSHNYGGFLTVSFCGNIWSHALTPNGMLKRNAQLLEACKKYPEACIWLDKYTTTSCFYDTESVCMSPFISGLATNYGVRYDNCGWNGAMDVLFGEGHGMKYPVSAGLTTVMEQTCVNGGSVWDGPELITYACFTSKPTTTVDGFTRRNWERFPELTNGWIDMFRKIIDGSLYIPTREEVVGRTKIAVIADQGWNLEPSPDISVNENRYVAWGSLYDNVYKQDDPFNKGNGQWHDNMTFFKKTGRYASIPVCIDMYDDLSKSIPLQVKKSQRTSVWQTEADKQKSFNDLYPEVSKGDLYVSRFKNQLITYTPYSYLNVKKTAKGVIPLEYNTCSEMELTLGKLSNAAVREYADHIDFYMNNYRCDTLDNVLDKIVIKGATSKPSFNMTKRAAATAEASDEWDAANATYTLNISHNGPVDITVNCSGNATGRATDVLPSASLAADLPKQPGTYSGPITIEAEDMDYRNIRACVVEPYYQRESVRGHSGNGFVETGVSKAAQLRHKLSLKQGGDYDIIIKYCSTQKSGTLDVEINGTRQQAEIEKTEKNQWKKVSVPAKLNAGENTLYLKNTAGIFLYLDYVTYQPKGTAKETFTVTVEEAEHGIATANKTTAAEGDIITFDIKADEGYEFVGWEFHPRQHPYFSDNTMQMPNDNVILKPLFKSSDILNAVYHLDFTNVVDGAMPEGWKTVQGGNEEHEYPNTYSSGARTFAGFTGYQGKGLYWRENCAEYGRSENENYLLHLQPGKYKLIYAMAAWKGEPTYSVSVTNAYTLEEMASSETLTARPNANGNKKADLSSAELRTMEFEVNEEDDFVITFKTGGFNELLLLECMVSSVSGTGIEGIVPNVVDGEAAIYGVDGIKRNALRKGINIVKMKNGETKKIFIK